MLAAPDGMSSQSVIQATYDGKAPWAATSELKNIKVSDAVGTRIMWKDWIARRVQKD